MISMRSGTCAAVLAAAFSMACGDSAPAEVPAGKAASAPAQQNPSARPKQFACGLVPREQIEAIAGEKLDMLHNIEEEDKTSCELTSAKTNTMLVTVTVYWLGGKELARTNQAAISMARQMMNDEETDIEELTGSGKVRGLADKAYFSDLMPSWFLKNDVLVEVISPRFGHDQTHAVFMAVAKHALKSL